MYWEIRPGYSTSAKTGDTPSEAESVWLLVSDNPFKDTPKAAASVGVSVSTVNLPTLKVGRSSTPKASGITPSILNSENANPAKDSMTVM